jgi:hypothetical protein
METPFTFFTTSYTRKLRQKTFAHFTQIRQFLARSRQNCVTKLRQKNVCALYANSSIFGLALVKIGSQVRSRVLASTCRRRQGNRIENFGSLKTKWLIRPFWLERM